MLDVEIDFDYPEAEKVALKQEYSHAHFMFKAKQEFEHIGKNAKAEGLYWGELAYREPKKIENDFRILEKLFNDKKLIPDVNKVFELKDASKALNLLSERKNIGKIVLKC